MNQRDILRRGEYQRNMPPEPREPEFVCTLATGCEEAQDGECSCGLAQPRRLAAPRCPKTGEAVEWKEV